MTEDPRELANSSERHQAHDPGVGSGTPDTAPWEPVEVGWLRRQPLLALVLSVLLPDLAALATELAGDTDPVLAVLLGSAATLLTAGGALAWRMVTPTALPRLAGDLPLTPVAVELPEDPELLQ